MVKYAKKANKAPALQFLFFFTGQVHSGEFVFLLSHFSFLVLSRVLSVSGLISERRNLG